MAVRFGLLGTGHWADVTHAPGIEASPGAELVGVWGRSRAKAAALAAKHGGRPYADVDELLADVDAVAIALPPSVQAELAVRAAGAGCHLALDKPLALCTADADRIVATTERNSLSSVVFFTAHFVPAVRRWYAELRRGQWDTADVRLLANIYTEGSPYAGSRWRQEYGALWDIGPHAVAAVLPVLGPVGRIAAGRGRGDTVHLVLEHESRASSTVTVSLTAPGPMRRWEVTFLGDSGETSMPALDTPAADAFGLAVSELVTAIEGGETRHPCDVRLGRDVVAVLEQAAARLARAG